MKPIMMMQKKNGGKKSDEKERKLLVKYFGKAVWEKEGVEKE